MNFWISISLKFWLFLSFVKIFHALKIKKKMFSFYYTKIVSSHFLIYLEIMFGIDVNFFINSFRNQFLGEYFVLFEKFVLYQNAKLNFSIRKLWLYIFFPPNHKIQVGEIKDRWNIDKMYFEQEINHSNFTKWSRRTLIWCLRENKD